MNFLFVHFILWTGIGYAMVVISTLVCIYYNMIIAYTFFYLFASFTSKLPWSECKEEWVKYGCREYETNATIREATGICNVRWTIRDIFIHTFGRISKSPRGVIAATFFLRIAWNHCILFYRCMYENVTYGPSQ